MCTKGATLGPKGTLIRTLDPKIEIGPVHLITCICQPMSYFDDMTNHSVKSVQLLSKWNVRHSFKIVQAKLFLGFENCIRSTSRLRYPLVPLYEGCKIGVKFDVIC